jgi:hypothetical protein
MSRQKKNLSDDSLGWLALEHIKSHTRCNKCKEQVSRAARDIFFTDTMVLARADGLLLREWIRVLTSDIK